MRVLLATHFFPPTQSGGTESYTLGLARALRRHGHEPYVICAEDLNAPHGWPPRVRDDVYDGIPVRRLSWRWDQAPHPFDSFYSNGEVDGLFRDYVNLVSPDTIHVTSCYSLGAGILHVARQAGCRTILTLTDFWFLCVRHTLLKGDGSLCNGPTSQDECQRCMASGSATLQKAMKVIPPPIVVRGLREAAHLPALARLRGLRGYVGDAERRLRYVRTAFEAADVVIAPSRFLRDMFVQNGYPSKRMCVSPYGLDLAWEAPAPRPKSGVLTLGYLGQIEPLKGVHVAVEAIRGLRGDVPVKLHIYGPLDKNSGYVHRLRTLANGDPRIEFMGPYDRRMLRATLASLDTVIVPSLWYENTPLVIGESFAANRPVLATDLGGMSEVVQHGVNGLVFNRGDVNGLRSAMRRFIDEPDLLERLRTGIPLVRTIDEEIVDLLGLYRNQPVGVSA